MNGNWAIPVLFSILILGSLGLSQQAFALPTMIGGTFNDPRCDTLSVPSDLHELGVGFPIDELISVVDIGTGPPACPSAGPAFSEIVAITNLSSNFWTDLWYVSETPVDINNFDGLVGLEAGFKIDSVGLNTPLIFESLTSDGVFEPGETWHFVIDNYLDLNTFFVPVSAFDSPGLESPGPSNGNIIAVLGAGPPVAIVGGTSIPIDTTSLLLAGVQSVSMWMIPVIAIGVVVGVFVIKHRK